MKPKTKCKPKKPVIISTGCFVFNEGFDLISEKIISSEVISQ